MSVMLVGNKLDLVEEDPSLRKVTRQEAEYLCKDHTNMHYIETSAMTAVNVNSAF